MGPSIQHRFQHRLTLADFGAAVHATRVPKTTNLLVVCRSVMRHNDLPLLLSYVCTYTALRRHLCGSQQHYSRLVCAPAARVAHRPTAWCTDRPHGAPTDRVAHRPTAHRTTDLTLTPQTDCTPHRPHHLEAAHPARPACVLLRRARLRHRQRTAVGAQGPPRSAARRSLMPPDQLEPTEPPCRLVRMQRGAADLMKSAPEGGTRNLHKTTQEEEKRRLSEPE